MVLKRGRLFLIPPCKVKSADVLDRDRSLYSTSLEREPKSEKANFRIDKHGIYLIGMLPVLPRDDHDTISLVLNTLQFTEFLAPVDDGCASTFALSLHAFTFDHNLRILFYLRSKRRQRLQERSITNNELPLSPILPALVKGRKEWNAGCLSTRIQE